LCAALSTPTRANANARQLALHQPVKKYSQSALQQTIVSKDSTRS
jgi:hypothetical protein